MVGEEPLKQENAELTRADAISSPRRSRRFSCSSSADRADSSLVTPGARPSSMSA
jgi:hypothetical protein